ncbi:hypothetical protein CS542_01755 [Pedobacter sp. IW39]|nr:hypothetical protein CS542_01755 [Pedobacter sp. IW39]
MRISHHIDGLGRYNNTFKGVPSNKKVYLWRTSGPQAESQIAIVTDNNDPSQTGGIKVQMLLAKDNSTPTGSGIDSDGGSSELLQKQGICFYS